MQKLLSCDCHFYVKLSYDSIPSVTSKQRILIMSSETKKILWAILAFIVAFLLVHYFIYYVMDFSAD